MWADLRRVVTWRFVMWVGLGSLLVPLSMAVILITAVVTSVNVEF